MDRDGASSSIEDFAHAFSFLSLSHFTITFPFPCLASFLGKVSDSPHDEGKNVIILHPRPRDTGKFAALGPNIMSPKGCLLPPEGRRASSIDGFLLANSTGYTQVDKFRHKIIN